jgi:hypothetical protein
MNSSTSITPRWMTWGGRLLTAIPCLLMGMSGAMKLAGTADVVRDFTGKFGFSAGVLAPIGLLELTCTVLYLVPRTALLGAILVTGYLGGAVVTHVRVGEYLVALAPALLGVFAWGGLYLRDPRVRALLPLRD